MTRRRLGVLAGAMLLAPAALHAQQAAPEKQEPQDIVVTGQRLDETEKALKDCLARHCPPAEDIKATLRHSENQFSMAIIAARWARCANRAGAIANIACRSAPDSPT